jgi:hypothetical protein
MFSKQLEFGGVPKNISVSIHDVLDCEQIIRSAILFINCHRHYRCDIFAISGKSRSPEVLFGIINIQPNILKATRVGNYEIVEQLSDTKILKNRRCILEFKKQFHPNYWPIKNLNAFEEKVNKLLLLK